MSTLPCDEECCCCCCSCFNTSKSVLTNVKYVLIILGTWLFCLLLLVTDFRAKALTDHSFCSRYLGPTACARLFGYSAIYRICFILGAFHFVMSLFLIGATNSETGIRTSIHHGVWPVKCVVLLGIIAAMLFVSNTSFLFNILSYVAMACGFAFNVTEILLLADMVHNCHESWGTNTDDGSTNKCRDVVVLFSTLIMYLATMICTPMMYIKYTDGNCTTNKFFIIFIMCHCIAACCLSMVPAVKKAQSNTGSFQTSIVTLFTLLMTWTAVSHQPYSACNNTVPSNLQTGISLQAIINTTVLFVLLIYGSFASSQERLKRRIWPIIKERKHQDEDDYSYSYFHLLLYLGSFSMMINLTNWYSPGNKIFKPSWTAVWAKMGACSISMWIYLWTLISPLFKSNDSNDKKSSEGRDTRKRTNSFESTKLSSSFNIKDASSLDKETANNPPSSTLLEKGSDNKFNAIESQDIRVSHGSMSRKNSLCQALPETGVQKEMLRLEGKVMRLQEKIAKLQTKVANLQGLERL